MFPYLEPPIETRTVNLCNAEMQRSNDLLTFLKAEYDAQWEAFWNPNATVEDMQAKLDLYATTPATDLGQSTNALEAYFAKAFRLLSFIRQEDSTWHSSAPAEVNGEMLPDFPSYPYQKYFSAGWYYSIDSGTGRMVVSGPCEWGN